MSGPTTPGRPARPTASDYHLYRPLRFRTPKGSLRLLTKPGIYSWRRPDRAVGLTLQCLADDGIASGTRVLDLGCGHGALGFGCAMIRPEIDLHLADASLAAYTAVSLSIERLGLPGTAWHSDVGADLPPDLLFDLVVAHLPRGRMLGEEFIREAWYRLEPGGRLYLTGSKDTGILTRINTASEWFGNGEMVGTTANFRTARFLKRPGSLPPPASPYHKYEQLHFSARDQDWTACTRHGVFGRRGLDRGTKLLIEQMQLRPGERVLDLGCGTGAVGLVAAGVADLSEVVLVDDMLPAVRTAQRTMAQAGAERARVLSSDAGSAVISEVFDVVVTNPPFHLGVGTEKNIPQQFIEDSRDLLGPKGRLFLVANTFLPYDKAMEQCFRRVAEVYRDERFRVLMGARPMGRVKNRPTPPVIAGY